MRKIVITFILALLIVPTQLQAANIFEQISGGARDAAGGLYGEDNLPNSKYPFLPAVINIFNILLGFIGVVFLGLLLYGGYLWMSARGNQEQIERAKKIIREVTIGILIIILARLFTELVLSQLGEVGA